MGEMDDDRSAELNNKSGVDLKSVVNANIE
jgi:hypothetical protein